MLDYFWKQLEKCDEKLKENSRSKTDAESHALTFICHSREAEAFVSAQRSVKVLFQGLDLKNVNLNPVLAMGKMFFTHLGIGREYSYPTAIGCLIAMNATVLNPRQRKSGTSTGYSTSEALEERRDRLSQRIREKGGSGKRNQVALKAWVRIYPPWSQNNLFSAVPSRHLNVMGNTVC